MFRSRRPNRFVTRERGQLKACEKNVIFVCRHRKPVVAPANKKIMLPTNNAVMKLNSFMIERLLGEIGMPSTN